MNNNERYIEYCSLIPPMEFENDEENESKDDWYTEEDRYEDYLIEKDEENEEI